MILDERTELADAGTLIGTAAATAILGDVIDTGAAPTTKDLGHTDDLYLVIKITTAVLAAGGAANVTFKLVSDSTSNLATSPTTHWTSGAIAKGTLVVGYEVCAIRLPHGNYERYVGVTYTPDTNDTTAGAADAYLTNVLPKNIMYPDAI